MFKVLSVVVHHRLLEVKRGMFGYLTLDGEARSIEVFIQVCSERAGDAAERNRCSSTHGDGQQSIHDSRLVRPTVIAGR